MIKKIQSELRHDIMEGECNVIRFEYEFLETIYTKMFKIPNTISKDYILKYVNGHIREDILDKLNQEIHAKMSEDDFLASLIVMNELGEK